MAVQKSKKSNSRRGMRRSHSALRGPALSIDPESGAVHLRHNISAEGYYRGRRILQAEEKQE